MERCGEPISGVESAAGAWPVFVFLDGLFNGGVAAGVRKHPVSGSWMRF
jgi:hypothetical protein